MKDERLERLQRRLQLVANAINEQELERISHEENEFLFGYWLINKDYSTSGFTGIPCKYPKDINSTKALSFVIRFLAIGCDSLAIVECMKVYLSDYCGYCGGKLDITNKCATCKKPNMLNSNNIFGEEYVVSVMHSLNYSSAFCLMNKIIRKEDKIEFQRVKDSGSLMPLPPTTGDYWNLEPWMIPHFKYNCDLITNNSEGDEKDGFIIIDKGFRDLIKKTVYKPTTTTIGETNMAKRKSDEFEDRNENEELNEDLENESDFEEGEDDSYLDEDFEDEDDEFFDDDFEDDDYDDFEDEDVDSYDDDEDI